MMNRTFQGFLLLMLFGIPALQGSEGGPDRTASELLQVDIPPGRLCDALAKIGRGQVLPIEAIGLYVAPTLYDPYFGVCEIDVEPEVFVELAPDGQGVSIAPEMRAALEDTSRPILIAFAGDIYGPKVLGPDIPHLPVNIAFSRRAHGFGYGFGYGRKRAKLVIRKVLAILKDPPDFGPSARRTPSAFDPVILDAALPSYHDLAWNVSLEGDVVLEVEIVDGVVAEPKLIAGDRLLAVGAFAHIKSWKVAAGRSAKFQITYRYRLEQRRTNDPFEPRITMQLPHFVEIVARRNGWL